MTFFRKSWNCDVSAPVLAGILFAAVSLFIYPVPQLFCDSQNVEKLLIFNCCAGGIFVAFSLALLANTTPYTGIKEKIGISLPDKKTLLQSLLAAPCLLGVTALITWHWKYTLNRLDIPFATKQWMIEHISCDAPFKLFLIFVLVVIVCPIAEELIFRRTVFGLAEKAFGANAAGFITAGIFSAAHSFLAGAPGLLIMGLAFQWIYSRKGNLAASIILHSACNAITLAMATAAAFYFR